LKTLGLTNRVVDRVIVRLLCIAFQSFIRPYTGLEREYPGCYRKAGRLFLEKAASHCPGRGPAGKPENQIQRSVK